MQVDFAENYAAVSQDDVQSAHAIYFVVISDNLNHDKYAVWSVPRIILKCLTKQVQLRELLYSVCGTI